jgi:hypothetical protein
VGTTGRSASGLPAPPPSPRELGGEPLFGLRSLGLFDREVGGHLINPGRHPIGQSPFDGEIGGMTLFPRGEFDSLLFCPPLGGPELRLEGFDMGFERSDDLVGERSFIHNPSAQRAIIGHPNNIVPTLGRPNPGPLVVSERFLPSAALCPLSDRLGRHAQQFSRLPVRKPLARQNCPPPTRRRTPSSCRGAARTLVHPSLIAQD